MKNENFDKPFCYDLGNGPLSYQIKQNENQTFLRVPKLGQRFS